MSDDPRGSPKAHDLRCALWHGGVWLSARLLVNGLLGLLTVAVAVAWIGLGGYGLFAGALGLVAGVAGLSYLGVGAYLLRAPGERNAAIYHQAFSLLGVLGLATAVVAIAALPWIGAWLELAGFEPLAFAMLASLPLVLVSRVPQCLLERQLEYPAVAATELLSSLLRHAVAIGLILFGLGPWGLVIGWWLYHATLLAGLLRSSGYRPRWLWRRGLLRPMLGFGLRVWSARSLLSLRELVNPLVVGRVLGGEAIGTVAIAVMLCEVGAMLLGVAQRLSGGLFGTLQSEPARVARAISEGTFAQVWLVGPVLLVVCWAAAWLLPEFLGPAWSEAAPVLPFVALGVLVTALTQLRVSALYTFNRDWHMVMINALSVATFAGASAIAVPLFGVVGFGLGSAAGAAILLELLTRRDFRDPRLGLSLASTAAFALALFAPWIGPAALAGLALLVWLAPLRAALHSAFAPLAPEWFAPRAGALVPSAPRHG